MGVADELAAWTLRLCRRGGGELAKVVKEFGFGSDKIDPVIA